MTMTTPIMTAETETIPAELLRARIAYDPATGALTWLPRPIGDFPSEHTYRNWTLRFSGKPALITRSKDGYLRGEILLGGRRYHLLAHRVAFSIYYGRFPLDEIDHVNGDRRDNSIANLRECNREQNNWNVVRRGRYLPGASRSGSHWRANIMINRKQVFLGSFDTEEAAHQAYVEATIAARGSFATAASRSDDDIPQDVKQAAEACFPGNSWNPLRIDRVARAILADRKRRADSVDLALLDFEENDPEEWARGHAHAKNVAMKILRRPAP